MRSKGIFSWVTAFILAVVIIPMGKAGKEGLSSLSGLTVTEGVYEMASANEAIIRDKGKDHSGTIWHILLHWKNGLPVSSVYTYDPEYPL